MLRTYFIIGVMAVILAIAASQRRGGILSTRYGELRNFIFCRLMNCILMIKSK
jgi:hypothetical protein